MRIRWLVALLAVVALVGGSAWSLGPESDAPPTLTVENGDETPFQVTAYAVEDRQAAMLTNFEVTTEDGDRRLATGSQLVWAKKFRNVTLADEGVPTTWLTVDPGENETTTIDGCGSRAVAVIVFEDVGANERHEWTRVATCSPHRNVHRLRLRDGGLSG